MAKINAMRTTMKGEGVKDKKEGEMRVMVEFGKVWGQDGRWAIECGEWNFKTMKALLEYYGIKIYNAIKWEGYLDGRGKERTGILYKGIATKNV